MNKTNIDQALAALGDALKSEEPQINMLQLIPQIPDGIIKISESGIFDIEGAERARNCGADAILVGEALMRSEQTEALIEAFHNA